jgi:hypothetical protein
MFVSEEEIVLKQEAGVKEYDSDAPPTVGLRAGAFAEVGTLILTNERLAYVSKGGAARAAAWLVSPIAAVAVEKRVSKAELNELMKHKGSYSIPLQQITKVETARHFGSAYLRVNSPIFEKKQAHSYIFGSGWSKNEDWVNAINSAIATTRSAQATPTTINLPPPPPPPPATQTCPTCGGPLWYIQQYQRWYCDKERKYV